MICSSIISALVFCLSLPAAISVGATAPINLRSAGKYQILSGAVITIGAGSLGVQPTFDVVSAPAVADLAAAISEASGLSGTAVAADLGGVTYTPGVYLSPGGAAFAMTGNVILSGAGTFIFYTPAALNITAGVVILINGATAQNVYWITGGAITTGASSTLVGIFMSGAAITTGASNILTGCLLAAAAVTVGAATIFNSCSLTEVVLPSGSLSISAPSNFDISNAVAGGISTAGIGSIVVTDSRVGGSVTSWSASVTASALKNSNGDEISPLAIAYAVEGLVNTGGITTVFTNQSHLSSTSLSPVVVANGAGAPNTSTWRVQLKISIPFEAPVGIYAGTIIHSVY